ncbi:MAG: carbonic anhydrase family protein [Actinomycetota bacterium]
MTDVQTADTQAQATPASVLDWLRASNERFAAGVDTTHDWLAQVRATAGGQYPLAAFVGCIDSRVPPEVVFDLGIGDVFAARTAGNVVDDDVLGSLEFASKVAGVKAIVVLGHSACGAVKGACDGVELGHLTGLLAKITPAVAEASGGDTAPGSGDPALVQRVVEVNVANVVNTIIDRSAVIAELVDAGELAVVGAVYDLGTGRITWM